MKSAGAAAEEAWLYLVVLKPGSRLALTHQHLFSPPTTYEALVGRLAAQVTSCPDRLARAAKKRWPRRFCQISLPRKELQK